MQLSFVLGSNKHYKTFNGMYVECALLDLNLFRSKNAHPNIQNIKFSSSEYLFLAFCFVFIFTSNAIPSTIISHTNAIKNNKVQTN
jgi:hypothetical protein